MDEKIHNVLELVLERTSLSNVMDNIESNGSELGQYLFSYSILSICSQAFVIRGRNVLKEAEWRSYVQLMKNCFQRGTIGEFWKRIEEDRWFDPEFHNYINAEIIEAKPR